MFKLSRDFCIRSVRQVIFPGIRIVCAIVVGFFSLFVSSGVATAQSEVSIGFPAGIIGIWDKDIYNGQGADPQQPVLIRTFDELTFREGIDRVILTQSSSDVSGDSTPIFEGNDKPFNLIFYYKDGTVSAPLSVALNWSSTDNNSLFGFLKSPYTADTSGYYELLQLPTTTNGISYGLVTAGTTIGDGNTFDVNISGDEYKGAANNPLKALNEYYLSTLPNRPRGPLTVDYPVNVCSTDKDFLISGSATLQTGETLNVVFKNILYTYSDGAADNTLNVSNGNWYMKLAMVDKDDYEVQASIVNSVGLAISDSSLLEVNVGEEYCDVAGIQLIKSSSISGDVVTYSYAARNTGNSVLSEVSVSELLTTDAAIEYGGASFTGSGGAPIFASTITLTDIGNIEDSSDDGSDLVYDTLGSGDTVTWTATYTLTQADKDAGGVTNQAVAKGTAPSGAENGVVDLSDNKGYGSEATFTGFAQTASLSVTKTEKSGQTGVGETLSWSIVVTNTGDVTLTGVTLSEDVLTRLDDTELELTSAPLLVGTWPEPAGVLAPDQSVTYTATYKLTQSDIDAGGVANSATASGTAPDDSVVEGTSDSDSETEGNQPTKTVITPSPELTVVKTEESGTTIVGETLSWSIVVTNTGDVTLTGVTLSEDVLTRLDADNTVLEPSGPSEGSWPETKGVLAPEESVTYTATYKLTQSDIDAGGVANSATASGTAPDDSVVEGTSDSDSETEGNQPTKTVITPSPKAESDRSFGNEIGSLVSVSVLTNDSFDGKSSPIVKLVDQEEELVSQVSVEGEGVWSVGEGNTVQFAPASDFAGDPTPIEYVITSSNAAYSNKATVYVDYLGVGAPDDLVAADDELVGQSSDGPVTVSPLDNDKSNVEDELVRSTLHLLDAGNNQVKELTVENEGTWKVDELKGTVTFTPVEGFTGSSVNVNYYIENEAGTPQTATIKILFIDPRGVVYDSSTLEPIAGVELKFAYANGNAVPASCLRDGQQPQTTGSDGRYQFDLSIVCTSAEGEEFQILVTSNEGYSLSRTADGLETASLNPGTPSSEIYEVVSYDRAPSVGEARKFYTSFVIGTNSRQIVNNHIPLTRLSKLIEDDLQNVLRDDLIATMMQQSRQMAGYAEGALQRLKDNTDNSCSAAIADQLEHNPVMFETALARIIPESAGTLDAVANLLAQCSDTAFDVEGHTDSRGDDADNAVLSNARATAVVKALRQRGTPVEQLSAVGYGENRPIADNATPEGQALNRRVVFTVFDQDLSNASCNENNILERSMDVKADQNGATVDGKYLKESRNCTANSWTTWEGAATFLKTDTGMSQGMLNITRRQEWLLDNDRLRGYFFGAYASNNDITGLATGSIKGFGLTAGGYGAQRISGGSYIDYYLGASTGRHNFDLDFDRVDGAINADGHYDYLATFAGLSFSGETKVGDYKIVPRAGFEAAWSPGGQADYVASREAISDASSLDTGGVSGGRLYGEVRFDDLAPNEPYQLAFKPKLFCDQPLGGGDGICGMGASIELSSTAIDGKGLFTFEIEAEQTRDSRFWGLSFDYSLPVWAGELNIINTLSNQGKLAFGLNYERAF